MGGGVEENFFGTAAHSFPLNINGTEGASQKASFRLFSRHSRAASVTRKRALLAFLPA